jgi:hypothetical protein
VLNKALQVVELILRHDKYRAKVTISCASRWDPFFLTLSFFY